MLQEVVQEVENTAKQIMNEIHTAFPGTISSYSPGSNTATVKPSVSFTTPKGKSMNYPAITNVPVVVPHSTGTGIGIAFPIKAGDSCLIVCAEQSLDSWQSDKEDDTDMKFDISNAICIPGLSNSSVDLQQEANDKNAVVIGCGDKKICVSESGIAISGDVTVDGNITCTGTITSGG